MSRIAATICSLLCIVAATGGYAADLEILVAGAYRPVAVAVGAKATDAKAAADFLALLRNPGAATVLKSRGWKPRRNSGPGPRP